MKYFLKIFIGFICILLLGQFLALKIYPGWFKHYGGTQSDYGRSIQQTSDGGYIVAGYTDSYTYGSMDIAIYKLDSSGNKVWFKHYGGTNSDYGYSIQQTSDGGYIVAGDTNSFTHGNHDMAIYKLDSNGDKVWFKHYGGNLNEIAHSIQQTSDGGYVVAGDTYSYSYGNNDFAIYRLDSSGTKIWFKHYGGSDYETAHSIYQTSDGGFVVAGNTESYSHGGYDIAIYRLNSAGNKVWFKHYGGSNPDYGYSIQQTSDGGYIVAGDTYSYSYGNNDLAIYKLNSAGSKVWFKHYGGLQNDGGMSNRQTSDGSYIVAGFTYSYSHGQNDFSIYKLNSAGSKSWFKHYGGLQYECAQSIRQTSDGGYVVTGHTNSYTYGSADFAIYKLDSNGDK